MFKPPSAATPVYIQKLYFITTFVYLADLWSIKLAINLFHLRLTRHLSVHKLAKYCLFLLGITFVLVVSLSLFDCMPFSDRWIGKCDMVRLNDIFWCTVAVNISTDVILCLVPFPALTLITEKRIKRVVGCVFCLAGTVVLVSLVRAVLIYKNPGENLSWILILSHIEVTAGLVIASLPEVSKYFTRKYLQSSRDRSRGNTNGLSGTRDRRTDEVLESVADARVKCEGFIGLRGESRKNRSDDVDVERNGSGERNRNSVSIHSNESTEHIVTAVLDKRPQSATWGITKTTTFEMQVL
jgi:hypothetical protein